MAIIHALDTNFQEEVANEKVVVANFWAPWCGPCRMFAPTLETYSDAGHEGVKVVKVNVDENPETAAKYGIMSIPTTLLFKAGELADKKVGTLSEEQLGEWVSKHQ